MSYIVPKDSKGRFIGWINGRPKEVTEKIRKKRMGHIVTKKTRDEISQTLKTKNSSNWDYLRVPQTSVIKEKIKLGMIGKHNSVNTEFKKGEKATNWDGFQKGHVPWNKNKEQPQLQGKNNSNYKGGIQRDKHGLGSFEYRTWRNKIFIHDNYTCLKCKKEGIYLHAHHIYNFAQYPKLRFDVNNGITFCKKCHTLFHHIYGVKNNTKEQIEKFLIINNNEKSI